MPTIVDIKSRNRGIGFGPTRTIGEITRLVIHHTGGSTLDGAIDTLQAARLAYHYFVEADGKIDQYVDDLNIAYHAGEGNEISIGIALIGANDDEVKANTVQVNAAVQLVQTLLQKYKIPPTRVYGHGELPGADKERTEGVTVATRVRAGNPPEQLPASVGRSGGVVGGGQNVGGRRGRRRVVIPNTENRRTDITPYIASLESFHPHIQYELLRRQAASETANTYMPFVRLTSLVNVQRRNLAGGSATPQTGNESPDDLVAFFPTLGIDGNPEVSFDDIYNPTEPGRSIVGYATKLEGNEHKRVKLLVDVEANETDQPNIPIPGISAINTERSTTGPMGVRGGLFKATINIKAYSVGQLNTLLKYFLRPATRVILELGRTSSSQGEQFYDTPNTLQNTTLFQKFNWKRSIETVNTEDNLDKMVKGSLGQKEFIQKYIYNNFGNYEIFIGYIVNFKIKYTKDNVYDIELLMHSVQQFEITNKNTGVQTYPSTNPVPRGTCSAIEIAEYFSTTAYWKNNTFAKLLETVTRTQENAPLRTYYNHVVPLGSNVATETPAYLITWEFFVDVVLNNATYGLLSVLQQSDADPDRNAAIALLRSSLIKPLSSQDGSATDLNTNEVAWHENLRSTDPNVMLIYNQRAQTDRDQSNVNEMMIKLVAWGLFPDDSGKTKETEFREKFSNELVKNAITDSSITPVGSFEEIRPNSGRSSLTKGVWLNTNAIIDAFTSTDTVSMAITKLLNSMNNAVQGYWNLQPLSSEETSGICIVDMGMSKTIEQQERPIESIDPNLLITNSTTETILSEVSKLTKDITDGGRLIPLYRYVFNRKSKTVTDTTKTPPIVDDIGSELLDINVESSLPQVVAVQAIAGVGGGADNATFSAINIDELRKLTIYDTYVKPEENVVDTEVCKDEFGGSVILGQAVTRTQFIPTWLAQQLINLYRRPTSETPTEVETIKNTFFEDWLKNETKVSSTPFRERSGYTVTQSTTAGKESSGATTYTQTPSEALIEARRNLFDEDLRLLANAVQEQEDTQRPGYLGLVRDFSAFFGMAIDLFEPNIAKLAKNLQTNKEEYEVHPFNSSNLTKTIVDLTLPGIGGIQLWQSFTVDRIPNIIKRGYYVTTKVSHEFTVQNGWITKIQGRFRYNPQRRPRAAGTASST